MDLSHIVHRLNKPFRVLLLVYTRSVDGFSLAILSADLCYIAFKSGFVTYLLNLYTFIFLHDIVKLKYMLQMYYKVTMERNIFKFGVS